MKYNFLFFLLVITPHCFSQFGEQLIISQEAMRARGVFAADLDGDLDLDVLSASENDNKIAWYENLDGIGTFGPQHIITSTLVASVDVFGADLDGDSDIDVLVASKGVSQFDSKVVWFENLDGQGSFSNEILISDEIQGAISVFAADLDGDMDMDVLSASFSDNTVSWFENQDGMGNFGTRQIITNTALSTRDVIAADMDGDLDLDIVTVSTASDELFWFENLDGMGSFGAARLINADTNGPLSVFAADVDGDNDLDIISNAPADDSVYWYENLDGLGNFGTKKIITQTFIHSYDVYAADLDNDLDMDVLAVSANDDKVVWFKNLDGLGNFGTMQIISTETDLARSVIAADIDDDTFLDVLSASSVDNKIAWYKNSGVFGVEDFLARAITVYPNPTQDTLAIKTKDITLTKVAVCDMLGRTLLSVNGNVNSLDVSALQSGVLFVKVYTTQGAIVKKVVKE
ncbi:MAG: T9SS type A sorting domain-containing protein [Flavobacteriaceae bacterium]